MPLRYGGLFEKRRFFKARRPGRVVLRMPNGYGNLRMRITEHEKNAIVGAVKAEDPDARVWLFGSRADDGKKGGDIDVGVLSEKIGVMGEIGIRQAICDEIGEQRIDLVVSKDGREAFFRHVVMGGIPLQ